MSVYYFLTQPPSHTPDWIKIEAVMYGVSELLDQIHEGSIANSQTVYGRILKISDEEVPLRIIGTLVNTCKDSRYRWYEYKRVEMMIDRNAPFFQVLHSEDLRAGQSYIFATENCEVGFRIMKICTQ